MNRRAFLKSAMVSGVTSVVAGSARGVDAAEPAASRPAGPQGTGTSPSTDVFLRPDGRGPEPAQEHDQVFFERELRSFVPERILDAHAHLWRAGHEGIHTIAGDAGADTYGDLVRQVQGRRSSAAVFIPSFEGPGGRFDDETLRAAANAWVAGESARARCPGLFMVRPGDDPEWVREQVKRLQLAGLKCYHTLARVIPTWEAQIPDYLPERLVQVAHQERWAIVLHLVRSRAVADAGNLHWIRTYCERYPDMRLILAHAARGFQPAHNLEGLPALAGLGNLYFDTSANCEPIAHQAIIRLIGHRRLMYGTDFPTCNLRGRSVAVADSFVWLRGDSPVWGEKHAQIRPLLVGLEHLRALKWACWAERLGDAAVEDIFWNNATKVFGYGKRV